ncbi:MAG: purine-binding chemotaxis protein CheW [Methylotenera sp.]|nr:purine-binding chemotaxis protein CheW [Oligoflexia bacterium]
MSDDNSPIQKSSLERYLSFCLGQEDYAIPLLAVREVIAVPDITPIPFTPPYFLGIMNLRGQVISVLDLRQKFNIKPQAGSETAVIICDLSPLSLGVVVDSINSVLAPNATDIAPKPEIQSSKSSDYITGVVKKDDRLILLLDIARCLSSEDQAALNKTLPKKSA